MHQRLPKATCYIIACIECHHRYIVVVFISLKWRLLHIFELLNFYNKYAFKFEFVLFCISTIVEAMRFKIFVGLVLCSISFLSFAELLFSAPDNIASRNFQFSIANRLVKINSPGPTRCLRTEIGYAFFLHYLPTHASIYTAVCIYLYIVC